MPKTGREVIEKARRQNMSFVSSEDIDVIAADGETRLQPLLVRCNGGRFVAPAQDVKHFIALIERSMGTGEVGEWVRDVSLVHDAR